MKTINYILVELEDAYDNEESGVIVNTTIEEVKYVNRIARVVAVPKGIVVSKGDYIIAHHNIFRLRNDHKGNVVDSSFLINGNLYKVPLTEVFMYKQDKDWIALDPYCFVEPIKDVVEGDGFNINSHEITHKGNIRNLGVMKYANLGLREQGVKSGDIVLFKNDSEYEFTVDGKVLYKMGTRDILGVV